MDTTLLSTINVMNFNSIGPTRALARKAYGPSTDFLFNNFTASRSFSDYINTNAEQEINDFMERYEDTSSSLSEVSSDLARLFVNVNTAKDVSIDSETLSAIAKDSAKIQEYTLSVEQLATTQIDTSKALNKESNELAGFASIDLSIEQGDHEFELSIANDESTSNNEILKKVSSAINQSSADLKATVLSDDEGNARLSIESTETGIDAGFEISGGLVDYIELKTVSSADNAEYTLDGATFENSNNTISIDDDNLEITFKNETSGDESINVTHDTSDLDSQYEKLSTELQNVSELFEDYRGESRLLNKYERRFNHLMNTYKDELESVGITKDDTGYISFLQDNISTNSNVNTPDPTRQVNQSGMMIDDFTKFALDLETQDLRTLVPSSTASNLPKFTDDDFLTYLSFSNRFNINAYYPTGGILDFML